MNVVVIGVASREEANARFMRALETGKTQGAYRSFESTADLWRTLSPKRWEMLKVMTGAGGLSLREVAGTRVDQVIVGSSVNSSFRDLMVTAKILEGRRVHPETNFHVNPGSRQVLENVMQGGGLQSYLSSGVRLHEPGCQGCIGMGQAPGTGEISLRTFPRNFPGRSGTKDDKVYLCSPETATASGLKGVITDPRDLAAEMEYPRVEDPESYIIDEKSIVFPSEELRKTTVVRGPNIKPLPEIQPLPDFIEAEVVLKVGDNVSTDAIKPAGNRVLPLRSNIEAISKFVFSQIAPDFAKECAARGTVVVVGCENFGQG